MARKLKDLIDGFVKGKSDGSQLLSFVESAGKSPALREGSVLHKPGRNYHHWHTALQSAKGYSKKNEVSLTRALFNLAKIAVGTEYHVVIAYEAPLLRTRATNSRQVSCDLVTMTKLPNGNFALTALEVKCRGYSSGVTSLPFGLLESWAYARLLAEVVEKDSEGDLRKELTDNWVLRAARVGTDHLTQDGFKLDKVIRHAVLLTENGLGREDGIVGDALRRLGKNSRLKEKENWVREYEGSTRFDGYWVILNRVRFREGDPGPGVIEPSLELDSALQIRRFPDGEALRLMKW
jgi:hypothetical protein